MNTYPDDFRSIVSLSNSENPIPGFIQEDYRCIPCRLISPNGAYLEIEALIAKDHARRITLLIPHHQVSSVLSVNEDKQLGFSQLTQDFLSPRGEVSGK